VKSIILLAFLVTGIRADVKISVGRLSDQRQSGASAHSSTSLYMHVKGESLKKGTPYRFLLSEIKDNTGADLKEDGFGNSDDFSKLDEAFGMNIPKGLFEFDIRMKSTKRTATSITIKGVFEYVTDSEDQEGVVKVNLTDKENQPVTHELLKAAKVKLAFEPLKSDQVKYTVSDPDQKIAGIRFYTPEGKELKTNGYMSMGSFVGKDKTVTYTINNMPNNVVAHILLLTDKNTKTIPVEFKDIPLP
jgi:hypothetical protein